MEVMVACPTGYGKLNKLGSPSDMLRWFQESSVDVARAAKMAPEELEGMLVTGVLHQESRPEYAARYQELVREVGGKIRYPIAVNDPVPRQEEPALTGK